MKVANMLLSAAAAAAMLAAVNPTLKADDFNEATKVTFSQAVQLPGDRVLDPGTYWFIVQNAHLTPDPQVVAIYNEDQTELKALLITKDVVTTTPAAKTTFTLVQQGGDRPSALLTWYYPGKNFGHEFIYSTHKQKQLEDSNWIRVSAADSGS